MEIQSSPFDSPVERGGRIPGSAGQHAYELRLRDPAPVPVLVAVPHAGRHYPESLAARMRHPLESSLRLEDRLVDLVADALSRETGAALLVAQAPRALIDLNRSPDDMDWSMVADPRRHDGAVNGDQAGRRARGGLGLVPRRLPGLGELWKNRLNQSELDLRIEHVHRPYHRALGATLEALRDRWGGALLIDLHSMPPLGPKIGAEPAPDFVLGDRFGASCSARLSALAMDHLTAAGHGAAHNRPYAGGYVLDRHAAPTRGIHALQVELCRTAYLDRAFRVPGPGLAAMVDLLAGLVRRLADELVGTQRLAEAAE